MPTRLPGLLAVPLLWGCCALAQVPVKVFTSHDGQTDKGTAQLVAAVKQRLGEMPKYKLWEGGPANFPRGGVLIDIQGIDVIDAEDEVVGSAVLLTCSTPAPHDAGYDRVLYRKLLEIVAGDKEIDGDARDVLGEIDRRVPAAAAVPTRKPARKPAHPARAGK